MSESSPLTSQSLSGAVEALWPQEAYEQKATLLAELGAPFPAAAQKAARCAECILARPTFDDEPPSFTFLARTRGYGNAREANHRFTENQRL